MKKTLILSLMLIVHTYLLSADDNKFTLTMKIDNVEDCIVTFQRFTNSGIVVDTFNLVNGVAKLETLVRDTAIAYVGIRAGDIGFNNAEGRLVYPHFNIMFAPNENYELEVTLERKRPPIIKAISAGPIGSDFAELQYNIIDPIEMESKQLVISNIIAEGDIRHYPVFFEDVRNRTNSAIKTYIKKNPTSFMTIYYYFTQYNNFDENEMEENYLKMPQALQNSMYGRNVKLKLDMGRKYRVGAIAPDFVRTSSEGNRISLSDYKGKHVLLDFWGTWCGPCRESHPHLVELYNEYSPKGLVFIGVAQEYGKDLEKISVEWKKAIADDGLLWTQILENEDENNHIVKAYNVSSFPTKILISPEGKIIAKLVGGGSNDLDEVLKKIFK